MKIPSTLLAALAVVGIGTAQAQEIPVRFAFPSGINGQLPKVIEQAGIAQKYGFAPTFNFFQYGPPMIEALAAGQVDVIFTSLNPTASYLAKHPGGLVIIADAGSSKHAVVVPQDSPIQTLKDFKGKKVAVSFNSDLHVDVVRAFKELGLDKEVELVNIQPLELAGAYEQGLTDGVDIRVPPLFSLTEKKGARIVQEWPWQFVVAVRKGFIEEHPGVVEKLREVLKDGIWYIASHPDEAAKWWGDHLRQAPEIVKKSADLNPLSHVKSREEINIVPSAEFKAKAEQWSQELIDSGIGKTKITYIYE